MNEPRMTKDDRERAVDARGPEAKRYYAQAMRESREILRSGRSTYYASQRRIGFVGPNERQK